MDKKIPENMKWAMNMCPSLKKDKTCDSKKNGKVPNCDEKPNKCCFICTKSHDESCSKENEVCTLLF